MGESKYRRVPPARRGDVLKDDTGVEVVAPAQNRPPSVGYQHGVIRSGDSNTFGRISLRNLTYT